MSSFSSSGRVRDTPWGVRDVPLWARDRRRALDFPGKWLLFGGVRPRDLSLGFLGPDLPSVADVQVFLSGCASVLSVFPVWLLAEGRRVVSPVEREFESRLPEVQSKLSGLSVELERFSFLDRLGLLSDADVCRFSDVLLESVVLCGRVRAFVERVCGGDFALFLYREGLLSQQSGPVGVLEDVLKAGGDDPARGSAEYKRFQKKFDKPVDTDVD